RLAGRPGEGFANEGDLVVVDAPVLERERARRVHPEDGDARQLDEWAKRLVDEAAVARQRREEAAQNVVQRDVVIAGHAEHLVPMFPEAFEELAGFPELLGTSALREIAADDDDVWLELVGLRF